MKTQWQNENEALSLPQWSGVVPGSTQEQESVILDLFALIQQQPWPLVFRSSSHPHLTQPTQVHFLQNAHTVLRPKLDRMVLY